MGDVYAFRARMNKGHTNMNCELVRISIHRSEFDEADHVCRSPLPISPPSMLMLSFR